MLLGACSAESQTDTTVSQDPTTTTTSAATPATTAAAASDEMASIAISGFSFSGPSSVSVGTTVTVENQDAVSHTWTSVDDHFDSGNLQQDGTFEFTFNEAGEYEFLCRIHPTMTGSITVEG
jgi:plastocyanin